jgi:hypothetical protein
MVLYAGLADHTVVWDHAWGINCLVCFEPGQKQCGYVEFDQHHTCPAQSAQTPRVEFRLEQPRLEFGVPGHFFRLESG